MARLYSNENFPLPTVEELRRLGHDVTTIQETGKGGQAMPDEKVMQFASEQDKILLTLNRRHFIRLHEQMPDHAGIIVGSVDPDFVRLAQRIHRVLESNPQLRGKRIRVNRE